MLFHALTGIVSVSFALLNGINMEKTIYHQQPYYLIHYYFIQYVFVNNLSFL